MVMGLEHLVLPRICSRKIRDLMVGSCGERKATHHFGGYDRSIIYIYIYIYIHIDMISDSPIACRSREGEPTPLLCL